jgi:hypothetical protein
MVALIVIAGVIKEQGTQAVSKKVKLMRYRPQRGSLDDSLNEMSWFSSLSALYDHLFRFHPYFIDNTQNKDDFIKLIKIEYYCYDDRVEAHLHIVTIKECGVGFIESKSPTEIFAEYEVVKP